MKFEPVKNKYKVSIAFYVEEFGYDESDAERCALNKLSFRGTVRNITSRASYIDSEEVNNKQQKEK